MGRLRAAPFMPAAVAVHQSIIELSQAAVSAKARTLFQPGETPHDSRAKEGPKADVRTPMRPVRAERSAYMQGISTPSAPALPLSSTDAIACLSIRSSNHTFTPSFRNRSPTSLTHRLVLRAVLRNIVVEDSLIAAAAASDPVLRRDAEHFFDLRGAKAGPAAAGDGARSRIPP